MISKLLYQVKLKRYLKTMDRGLNWAENEWYEIYEKALTKKQGGKKFHIEDCFTSRKNLNEEIYDKI
jgi:hypothetical protein